ncbi:MAG: hypothetical protein V4439_02840 [Patescibacteria group bacterium]
MSEENKNQINIDNISGDVVVSEYQSGGITAHSVYITQGVNKRVLTNKIDNIIEELKKSPVAAYRLHYAPGDDEVNKLTNELNYILSSCGWKKMNPVQRLGGHNLPVGITIFMLKPEEPLTTLVNLLWNALGHQGVEGNVLVDVKNIFTIHGWPPVELPIGMNGAVIFIGSNPDQLHNFHA